MLSTTGTFGKRTVKKINDAAYARLLASALPKIIETKSEHKHYIALVEKLILKGNGRTNEERALTQLLAALIHEYEGRIYVSEKNTPHDLLLSFMEDHGLRQVDLLDVFGSRSNASLVCSGKRTISKEQAKKLAKRFGVRVEAFL